MANQNQDGLVPPEEMEQGGKDEAQVNVVQPRGIQYQAMDDVQRSNMFFWMTYNINQL